MGNKASILIADDNINFCKTMSFVLERKGYAVTIAKDGPGAIQKVKEKSFDIIFMDIKMPLMDGVKTYKRIKEISPEAVVVMMTAYSVEDLVQEALREGAYGIIYKPLDIEKVVALIEEVRQAKRGALVLVVDDHPETCLTLKNILIKKHYEVGIAFSGEEALAMARKNSYDIIFIDMKLPTINGLETYLSIKESNPGPVVVMMTAYGQEMAELVEEALNNSAYACLYKPFDMEEVLRLLNEIRERRLTAR
jgi:two-component system response regulator HydG